VPLIAGAGAKAHSANVAEMVKAFKRTGRIGNSKPGGMKKALAQANAAAYRKQRESRRTIAHG
jgi:hypothetical protein